MHSVKSLATSRIKHIKNSILKILDGMWPMTPLLATLMRLSFQSNQVSSNQAVDKPVTFSTLVHLLKSRASSSAKFIRELSTKQQACFDLMISKTQRIRSHINSISLIQSRIIMHSI